MFIRQSITPVVLFCVSDWFELCFPVATLPIYCPYSYISLHLGCTFCYDVGCCLQLESFWEDQDYPRHDSAMYSLPGVAQLLEKVLLLYGPIKDTMQEQKLFAKFPILFFQEVSREWSWAMCRF